MNSKGYGAFTYNGKRMVAVHRFIYQQLYGQLPREVFCLHKCDTPRCVNPEHLFLGDDKANSDDKVAKMRHTYGERNRFAVLTEADVLAIRREYRGKGRKGNAGELAKKYGVTMGAIYCAATGRSWAHLNSESSTFGDRQ